MTFGDISFSNSSLEQPIENITPKQSTEKDSFEMDKNNPVYYAEKLLYDERKAEEEKEQQHDKEIIDAHRQYIRSLIHHKTKDIEEQQQKIKNPIFDKAAYSSTKDGSSFHTASWSKLRPEDIIANHLPTIYGADVSSMKHAAAKAIEQFQIEQKQKLLQNQVKLPKISSPKTENTRSVSKPK